MLVQFVQFTILPVPFIIIDTTSIALKSSVDLSSAAHQNKMGKAVHDRYAVPVVNSWIDTLGSYGG